MLCRIRRTETGVVALNVDGSSSKLYEEALTTTGSVDEALNIWAISTTDDFGLVVGEVNDNDNVSLNQVLSYYNGLEVDKSSLSPREELELKAFMETNGFQSMSDLHAYMKGIFGVLSIDSTQDTKRIFQGGILKNIDINEVNSLLNKIENTLRLGDIYTTPVSNQTLYRTSEYKTIFGTDLIVTQEDIDVAIGQAVKNFSDREEFTKAVLELPYTEFVEKFASSPAFNDNVYERYSNVLQLRTVEVTDNGLVELKSSTAVTVRNTISRPKDPVPIISVIREIQDIEEDIWLDNEVFARHLLTDLEKRCADEGIDVVGVSDKWKSRDDLMNFLKALNNLVNEQSGKNITDFSEKKDILIPPVQFLTSYKAEKGKEKLRLFRIFSSKNLTDLYDEFGLLKIDENIYHRIQRGGDKVAMYDELYDRFFSGDFKLTLGQKLPKEARDLKNKNKILLAIQQEVNNKQVGFYTENHEEAALYQIFFNHNPNANLVSRDKISGAYEIESNPDYIKTAFVADFYKYVLQEKLAKSIVYKNILSKLDFNDTDISMREPISSIAGIKYEKEFSDYIRLKKDSEMDYLLEPPVPLALFLGDLIALNNPQLVQELKTPYQIKDGYLITRPNQDDFLNLKGQLYHKELMNGEAHLYAAVKPKDTANYIAVDFETEFNMQEASSVINNFSPSAFTAPSISNNVNIDNKWSKNLKTPVKKLKQAVGTQLEIVYLYPESEGESINDKLNSCGK